MTATDFTPSSFGVRRVELEEWTEAGVAGRKEGSVLSTKRSTKLSYYAIDCYWRPVNFDRCSYSWWMDMDRKGGMDMNVRLIPKISLSERACWAEL
jgi:hypothetical protein